MTDPLPSFNLTSICPKCGQTGGQPPVRMPPRVPDFPGTAPFPVEYHAAYPAHDCRVFACKQEHLHRTCPRCGFQWAEACVAAAGEAP